MISRFGKTPLDVYADARLSSAAKVVFGFLAAESCGTDRTILMSCRKIASGCTLSHTAVRFALRDLKGVSLLKTMGNPVRQIQPYRICHPMFGPASEPEQVAAPAATEVVHSCGRCAKPCRRLTRAGFCRGCANEVELEGHLRELRVEHPGLADEALAKLLMEREQLRRMTARVRRVLRKAVA